MKTAKEFIERMQSDEAFAAQMREKVAAAKEAGAEDLFAAVSAAAKEEGYEISPEQLKEIIQAQMEDVSEEELGKVAGGTSCPVIASILLSIDVSIAIFG